MKSENYLKFSTGFAFLFSFFLSFYSVLLTVTVQLLSHVRLFAIPWTTAHQASLSITNSCSLLKLMSIESVMLSNHLILCHPLLLLPSLMYGIMIACIREGNGTPLPSLMHAIIIPYKA